jgi:hypothetical protein
MIVVFSNKLLFKPSIGNETDMGARSDFQAVKKSGEWHSGDFSHWNSILFVVPKDGVEKF